MQQTGRNRGRGPAVGSWTERSGADVASLRRERGIKACDAPLHEHGTALDNHTFPKNGSKIFLRRGLDGRINPASRCDHWSFRARDFRGSGTDTRVAARKIAERTVAWANHRSVSGARLAALAGRSCMSLVYQFAPGASIRPASGGSAFRTHCQCSLMRWIGPTTTEVKLCTNRKASRSTRSTFP